MPTVHVPRRPQLRRAPRRRVRRAHGARACRRPTRRSAAAIGSCRDSAWLLVSLLRQYGLAARFVSGYLVQLAADQKALDGPSGTDGGLHRPARLDRGLHPRRRLGRPRPDERPVRRRGPHPAQRDAAPAQRGPDRGRDRAGRGDLRLPQRGARGSTRTRARPSPTPTQQWARIDALGGAVDERLIDGDVRLTMGGEPTFVSLDDATSAEWNTDADGPSTSASSPASSPSACARTYALGGVVHRGQGKWYPGEPLPRWNIALQWRTDGGRCGTTPSCSPTRGGRMPIPTRTRTPRRSPVAVTAVLGSRIDDCCPAYEDPFAEIAAEIRKPEGPRPDLDDAADVGRRRARPQRHHRDGLGAAAHHRGRVDEPGVALPPRPPRAHAGHQRRRPAAAAGLDLVGGPGAPRRAVVPRGRAAAATPASRR